MNPLTVFQIIGFIGAILVVVSAIGTWHYGEIEDTKKQQKIQSLVQQNTLMMHAMESSGQAKWSRNKDGDITGVIIELTGRAVFSSKAKSELALSPVQKQMEK